MPSSPQHYVLFSNPMLAAAVGAVLILVMLLWQRAERADRDEHRKGSLRGRRP